ncbi:MAG: AAA family ATPase [Pseudomonadota bacterium]
MEPLQEAIERARQEREGKIGQTPGLGSGRPENDLASEAAALRESEQANENLAGATDSNEEAEAPQNGAALPVPSPPLPTPAQLRFTRTRQVEPGDAQLAHNRVIAGNTHDPRVESYRQLRSQVLATMKRNAWHTLAITSPQENAGKTLTAVNLAISISQEVNQTVMLVDLDLRKPNVHTTLGIEISKGIVDHLMHGEPIGNILLSPGYPRFVVMPGMPQGRHASEMLTSPEMKAFLNEIINRYPDRFIIFDLPPLLRNDDAMVFTPSADACLMVVEDGVSTREDIRRSMQLLNHSELIGTILNKAR